MDRCFRFLTSEELNFVSGGEYYTGKTTAYYSNYDGGGAGGGYWGSGSGGYDTAGWEQEHSGDESPYEHCRDKSQMTPEEREDYEVAEEAAEIAREIAAMADKDSREYGAIIYRDANGVITHTALTPGTATSVPNMSTSGMPGWGSALAIVHSHPASLWDPNYPSFRMHPTPYGDWDAFNGTQKLIADDLINNRGYSFEAAWAQANQFVYFIFGAYDAVGTNRYALHRFDDSDEAHQVTTSENQLAYAESVNTSLGTC
jgi:hypothetical protein